MILELQFDFLQGDLTPWWDCSASAEVYVPRCCFLFTLYMYYLYELCPQKVYIQQRNSNIFFLADRAQTLDSRKSEFVLLNLMIFCFFFFTVS